MLYGIDISHHNKNYKITNEQFVICKATEGKTYLDPEFHNNIKKALDKGCLIGAYHFARPENNSAYDEVVNFVNAVKPYLGRILLVLDYEGKALTMGKENWAHQFLYVVESMTGVKPLIYLQKSALKGYPNLVTLGYKLWLADYSENGKIVSPWAEYTLLQYTSKPIDKDKFNGDASDWNKLCHKQGIDEKNDTNQDSHFCGCTICNAVKDALGL